MWCWIFEGTPNSSTLVVAEKSLQSNTLVGTPEYFAPESIIGKGAVEKKKDGQRQVCLDVPEKLVNG